MLMLENITYLFTVESMLGMVDSATNNRRKVKNRSCRSIYNVFHVMKTLRIDVPVATQARIVVRIRFIHC